MMLGMTRRASRSLVGLLGLPAVLLLMTGVTALAAVEPGIYFDTESASAGDRVTLFSAGDYALCFSPDTPEGPEDWTVHLAPAAVSSPGDSDLILLEGTWSEQDGAFSFAFIVPSLDAGEYRGYVACASRRLDPSTVMLRITGPPATDTVPSARPQSSGTPWLMAIAAGLITFAVTLGRWWPARSSRRA